MAKQRILDTGNTIALEYPSVSVPRNTFDGSHQVKFSGKLGMLYPCLVQETVPGGVYHYTSECLTRMMPMLAPVYQNFIARIEYFSVDNYVTWPNFYKFISQVNASDVRPAAPFVDVRMWHDNAEPFQRLYDYLGLPSAPVGKTVKASALPFAAYQKVICDWYRDEDLQNGGDDVAQWGGPLIDGDNTTNWSNLNELQFRNNDRDYYRSAKPYAQKGDPVVVPLLAKDTIGFQVTESPTQRSTMHVKKLDGTNAPVGGGLFVDTGSVLATGSDQVYIDPGTNFQISAAELQANASLINDLRSAEALQTFLEAQLMGGGRYNEMTRVIFGVDTDDRRVGRSEFHGMFSMNMSISEVLNTTGTADAPQGTFTGHGVAMKKHPDGVTFHAKEHGYLIGLYSLIPAFPGYYQGIPKHFLRFDHLDYLWPQLAELGMEMIANKEVYFTGEVTDDDVWGYIVRYASYRMNVSRVSGDFRTTLDYWQDDNKFESLPDLNSDFLGCFPTEDLNRIFTIIDPDTDNILVYIHHRCSMTLPLPRLVRPGIS